MPRRSDNHDAAASPAARRWRRLRAAGDRGDATGATAIVNADVLTVIPFAAFHIQEQATAPLEIFVGTP